MSHFAQVKNNQVQQVIVAESDVVATFADSQDWIQTSYNTYRNVHRLGGTPLRGNYAGIGDVYDPVNDVFYPEQPFDSWSLNTTTWSWEPPVPHPADGLMWSWDEQQQQWVQDPSLG